MLVNSAICAADVTVRFGTIKVLDDYGNHRYTFKLDQEATRIPLILEDAENGLPMAYRPTLHRMYMRFCGMEEELTFLDDQIKTLVKGNNGCRRLLKRPAKSIVV